MLKSEKEKIVAELAEKLKDTPTLFVADYRGAEIRNFCIESMERGLRKFQRWREVFLEFTYVLLRAFDLIRRQRAEDSLHRFDFRHAMAKHHDVVSGLEAESNGVVQPITRQNRAHIEIVSHNQAFETKFVA